MFKLDKTAVRVVSLKKPPNDFEYWQSQPPETRLAALEHIRQEYNAWKYPHITGLSRVYRIIKRS
jgi:hypothetical protein